jgi:chromosome segregation ATPase
MPVVNRSAIESFERAHTGRADVDVAATAKSVLHDKRNSKGVFAMPTKKKTSPARRKPVRRARKTSSTVSWASKAASSFSAMASTQLKQLRKTVDQLKARLEKEARARSAASTVIGEAKKARETLMVQMKALRDQGASLTKELKKAMSDASRRENARQQAVAKISELRAELARRTEELKRKSEELARLAMESAGRAKDIIMSGGSSEASASAAVETDSVTKETEKREESPNESSIERELHPERKG